MAAEPKTQLIDLEAIRTDGECQGRVALDTDTVREYADSAKAGKLFPSLTVFYDGGDYWLADGFHRIQAYRRNKTKRVRVEVKEGDVLDARLYAAGANADHGLKRSNADKQKALALCLATLKEKGEKWTQKQIAEHCGISEGMVSAATPPNPGGIGRPKKIKPTIQVELSDGPPDADLDAYAAAHVEATEGDGPTIPDGPPAFDGPLEPPVDVERGEQIPPTPGQKAVAADDAKREKEKAEAPVDAATAHAPANPPKLKNGREAIDPRALKKVYGDWGRVVRMVHSFGKREELSDAMDAIEGAFQEAMPKR